MKRILAFMLSFALAFTSFSIVGVDAAASVSKEAKALATIGMLEGDGGGVTVEYTAKQMDRFTAAISILKLRGIYQDALDYKGYANFNDIDVVKWEAGKRVLAYLKANPDLGFIGNERGEFQPYVSIDEQSYYKVMLETLGYKQSNGRGTIGDFSWNDTMKFAESIGLKPTYEKKFTVDLLAKATVQALKTKTKDGKVYINLLIDEGKVKRSHALVAGLIRETLDAKIKSVKAVGNTVVEIVFDEKVDRYDAENLDNYSIDGLTIKDAVFVKEDTVRLETSAQSTGKLYVLKVGEVKTKFSGAAKVSGAPRIRTVKSEDIETVTIEFDKQLDFETASDRSNYYISGVDIEEVEIEEKKVTLTTYGLLSRKQYTVKVTNIKSVDGALLRSETKSFYTRPDIYPPTVKDVKAETNQRVVVSFSEAVSRETAEDLANYTIKGDGGELYISKAELVGEDEDKVELTTETQRASIRYEITIDNISDKTKAANVMKRPVKKTFFGMREDRTPPQLSRNDIKVLSRNHIQLAFTDKSRMDEATVLDPSNYEIIKNDRYKDEIYVASVEKASYDDGKYKVILEVDDLTINSNYTITVYNIADEFGNVLEKNNSLYLSARRDDFAASTVKDYKVVSSDEIELYFTKPLNKDTAEDIANYEINNSIGCPIKATYEDEKVVLETAKMVEGKIYKLTIDGVMDQAGNNLKLSFEFRATEGERDETDPRLEYIYSVDKYVVAAVFDEPVRYTTEGDNKTILVLKSGKTEIELYAKALSDDNRVIEFSNIEAKKPLSYNEVFTIDKERSLKGITDRSVNRNKFDTRDLDYYDFEVYGNYDDPEAPEVYYITQRDGKTFEVELSKEVVIEERVAYTTGTPSATFDVDYDPDDDRIITFTITSSRYIDGDKDYRIDISKVLADKHGVKAENTEYNKGYTIFYGEYRDEDKPYIVDVNATDRFTVEVEYNEAIGSPGRYTIKNTDETGYYRTISNSLKKIDKNKVILTLGSPLEGRYDYVLIIDVQAKDLVGNVSEEIKGDEFYFIGSDLAPVNVPDVDYKDAEELVIELEKAVEDLGDGDKINRAKTALSVASKKVALVKDLNLKKALNSRIEAAEDKIQQAEDKLIAAEVIAKIAVLPKLEDITLEHKEPVEAVRVAYDDLTENQRKLVTNLNKLIALEDKLAAIGVINKIDALPELEKITLEDKEAVEAARAAYDKLTEDQKKLVTNFDKLTAAEEKIAELEAKQQRLIEEQRQREADELAATGVIEKIIALPELEDITIEHKEDVDYARAAYNALSENQKLFVTNLGKLTAAEEKIEGLEVEEQRLIEEQRQREAEEAAKLSAAIEAARSLEGAVSEETLGSKLADLSIKLGDMEKALSDYLSPVEEPMGKSTIEKSAKPIGDISGTREAVTLEAEGVKDEEALAKAAAEKAMADAEAALEKAIVSAEVAVKEAEKAIEAAVSLEVVADEALKNLPEGEEKLLLEGKIDAAKIKIEKQIKTIVEVKGKIAEAKVKAAKKWLTADKFKFSDMNKADSLEPIILPLAPHKIGAVYKYKEVGKIVDGKFIKDGVNKTVDDASLQIVETNKDGKIIQNIKIIRGKEYTVITLKVEIISGDAVGFKLFNVNIPKKSENNESVTIE